jgi:hypothetical protein
LNLGIETIDEFIQLVLKFCSILGDGEQQFLRYGNGKKPTLTCKNCIHLRSVLFRSRRSNQNWTTIVHATLCSPRFTVTPGIMWDYVSSRLLLEIFWRSVSMNMLIETKTDSTVQDILNSMILPEAV